MTTSGRDIAARTVAAGEASGEALVLTAPISLWGGIDAATGVIIERAHPQRGASMQGRVVIAPGTHGSNGGSSMMLECVRAGTAPAAWVLQHASQILLTGVIVARELYGTPVPMVTVEADDVSGIEDGAVVDVRATAEGATVTVR